MDGNLSSKGQSAEWLVELCSAGLTAVDWVEREPQGMHQLGVEEKNWEGNSCPLQTATMADINKTEPVFSVCLKKKNTSQCHETQEKKLKQSCKGTNCQMLYTLHWAKTEQTDARSTLNSWVKRKDKWPHGITNMICLRAVVTWWWLVYHHKNWIFQVKKCRFYN